MSKKTTSSHVLNLKLRAPMKAFKRGIEEELNDTTTSKDKLSSFALAILNKENKIITRDEDVSASRYHFTIDMTQVIATLEAEVKAQIDDRLREEFYEGEPDDTAVTLKDSQFKRTKGDVYLYQITVSGDEELHEQTTEDIDAAFPSGGMALEIDLPDTANVSVKTEQDSVAVGTRKQWFEGQKRLYRTILQCLDETTKTKVQEHIEHIRESRIMRTEGETTMKYLNELYSAEEAQEEEKMALFLRYCQSKRGEESMHEFFERLQTIALETPSVSDLSIEKIYSHKAIAALMTSEENDDAANQISRTSVVMKLKEAHKKNEFLSSQQIIKELEIANSSVTASEEISSVGKRRSKALKALQVEETAGGGYQPRVDYSNQSIIDALAMSARSQQGTFQATEWLNEIARSVFQREKEKASGSETRRKYTPPSRAYEGGKRFNQDAKWCYKCFVNKDHDIRFRGYNQLDITGLHSHDQDHCPGRPSKKARKAANGI